jgi:hypothetical protein
VVVVADSVAGAAAGAGTSSLTLEGGSSRLFLTLGAIQVSRARTTKLMVQVGELGWAELPGGRYLAVRLQGYLAAIRDGAGSDANTKGQPERADQQRNWGGSWNGEDDERAGPEDDIHTSAIAGNCRQLGVRRIEHAIWSAARPA